MIKSVYKIGMVALQSIDDELFLSKVSIFRGHKLIVDEISFRLPAGGICLLQGPNGAGKTSLLRVVAGFLPANAGVLSLGAHLFNPVTSILPIWYIGAPFGFHPSLTAAKNLSQIASMRNLSLPIDDSFHIKDFADQPLRTLSSGQLQRLALSQLLLRKDSHTPDLWLLDEPNSALDSYHCLVLETMIEKHIRSGGRVIAATHQPLCEHLSPEIIQLEAQK
ncbi:MAG: heme ABC exporter ATP-binding protein CcmA [Alphaproteobacteria bacterium]|nr:heme ABC exporter ATP-binding protein CcmA [Alphaproteobacteria bacterium]